MRLINLDGRLHLVDGDHVTDVEQASSGRFSASPQRVYERWSEFTEWARTQPTPSSAASKSAHVGAPVPSPRQIFAVGLNYLAHADESGFVRPENPVIFTKFASSISGPESLVELPSESVDWEVELVVVLGRGGRDIAASSAWDYVAGLTVGQDISERERQHSGPAPQFSLAKSHAGFSPVGPVLVTPDELDNPDDLELGAEINGEQVQYGRTSQLIFPISTLIESLSRIVELYPGDVIFTGTPAGVGAGRTPPRYLKAGDVLRSYVTGIGDITQTFTSPASKDAAAAVELAPTE